MNCQTIEKSSTQQVFKSDTEKLSFERSVVSANRSLQNQSEVITYLEVQRQSLQEARKQMRQAVDQAAALSGRLKAIEGPMPLIESVSAVHEATEGDLRSHVEVNAGRVEETLKKLEELRIADQKKLAEIESLKATLRNLK